MPNSPVASIAIVIATALAFAAAALPSQTGASTGARLDSAQRIAIDSVFSAYDKPASPGCALGVFRDGEIAYERGYGRADLEHDVPITTATLFDVGSTSKQFAAASIALLAQEHKLAFSDPVRKYIPELPDYGAPLTIDDMMRHISGLRDYAGLLSLAGHSLLEATTDSQALALIVHQRKLNFPTGSRFEYSNTGFFLLSVIVQRVTGGSLADFAHSHIFVPLGMTHTLYRNHYAMLIPNRAMGYAPADSSGGYKNSMSNWEQTGDGAVQTSVEDLLKWDENFYTPLVGGSEMVAALQQRGTLANGDSIGYARGLFTGTYRGLRRIEHSGDWVGYHAAFARFPARHTSIVVLCNSDGISPGRLGERVADIVLAKWLTVTAHDSGSSARASSSGAAAAPTALAGGYLSTSTGDVIRITHTGDSLALDYAGQSFPLARTGPLAYEVSGLPVRITFELDAAQSPTALVMHIGSSDSVRAERFVPATPATAELRSYAGRYHSPELDVTWPIAYAHGELRLENNSPDADITGRLEPAMRSVFTAGSGTLRFVRDKTGRVTGFTLSASRMRGIVFNRIDG